MNCARLITILSRSRSVIYIFVAAILSGHILARAGPFASDTPATRVSGQQPFTPHDELYAIDLTRQGSGWAVGKFGKILHTSDNGKTWTTQTSGTDKSLTSVSFADELRGFVVGGGGTIMTTTDGGKSWRMRESGIKDHLLEVFALSSSQAFVSGAFGTLLSTRDGGASWQKHSLPWPRLIPRLMAESGQVEPHLNAVYFVDDQHGWLAGEFGLILQTRDGAQTWIARRFGADFPQIVSLRFLDRRTGWAAGARGTLLHTNDGGETWREIDAGSKQDFYALWIDGRQGLIAGQGVVLRTRDGGLNWAGLEPAIGHTHWLSGVAGNADAAVVVGQAGVIRRISLTDGKSSQRKAATP